MAADGSDHVFGATSDPYAVHCWLVKTGEILRTFSSHKAPVSILLYLPLTATLVTASWDKTLKTLLPFSKTVGEETLNMNERILDVKASRNEKQLFVALQSNEIQILDVAGLGVLGLIDARGQLDKRPLCRIEVTFDNSRLLAAGANNTISVYDINHRAVLQTIQVTKNKKVNIGQRNSANIVDGVDTKALEMNASADNRLVLPGSALSQHRKTKQVEDLTIRQLNFSKDGQFLCLVSNEGMFVFEQKMRAVGSGVSFPRSKEEMLSSLQAGKLSVFILNCIRLGAEEPVRLLLPRISPADARDIAVAIQGDELNFFVRILAQELKTSGEVVVIANVIRQILLVFFDEFKRQEKAHLARLLLTALNDRFRDFNLITRANLASIEFLLKDAN